MTKKGRPKKEDTRNLQYRLRLNAKEAMMLVFLSDKKRLPTSDIIRKAIRMMYNLEKNNVDLD